MLLLTAVGHSSNRVSFILTISFLIKSYLKISLNFSLLHVVRAAFVLFIFCFMLMKTSFSSRDSQLFLTTSLKFACFTLKFKNLNGLSIGSACSPQVSNRGTWLDSVLARCSTFTCPTSPRKDWLKTFLMSRHP